MLRRLLLIALAVSLNACENECGDQRYYAEFFITDKKSGKPYFEVSKDNPDSLRVHENNLSGRLAPISKKYDTKRGYIFGGIDIFTLEADTLYISLNRMDTDTLLLTSKVTITNKKCRVYHQLITATYNGHFIKQISSDTTGGFATVNLIK